MSWRNRARKEAIAQLGTGATNRAIRFNMAVRLIGRGARVAIRTVKTIKSVVSGGLL